MVPKQARQADQHQSSMHRQRGAGSCIAHVPQWEVIDDAIQIMGGLAIPMKRASPASGDVRCERIGGGTDEMAIDVAGR